MTSPRIAHLLGIAMAVLSESVNAEEVVEVFKLSTQPDIVGSTGTTVYVVDAMRQYMNQLSAGLPPMPSEAARIAKARLEALGPQEQKALRIASTARIRAAEYRISKTPAIVFDGRAVLYGINDVEKARLLYRSWLANGGTL